MLEVNARYPLTGMSCVSCAGSIESLLKNTLGITEAHVNFSDHALQVKFAPETISPEKIQAAIQQLGYGMLLPQKGGNTLQEELNFREKELAHSKRKAIASLTISIPPFLLGMFWMHWEPGFWISAFTSLLVVGVLGKHFFKNATQQLKHANPGMDLLVALSAGISWLYSFYTLLSSVHHPNLYFESASVVVAFVLTGKWLEEKARLSSSKSIQQLMQLQQAEVEVIDEAGKVRLMPAYQLEAGMRVRIKAGDKLPADGWLIEEEALIDEQLLTGESIPVTRLKGEQLWAGTLNGKITFTMIASATGENTRLAHLIRRVKEAQNSKAPVQKLADKIARWFVPMVVLIAVSAGLLWGFFGGEAGWSNGLNAFLSILVVACPCALGLATPTALMTGLGKAAELGILIRNAEVLERASKINFLFLDKTGTLTTGNASVIQEEWWEIDNWDKKKLRAAFLGLLTRSNHPLAASIAKHWQQQGIEEIVPEHAESIPGAGTWGRWQDSLLLAGSQSLMSSQQAEFPSNFIHQQDSQEVWFCIEKKVVGLIKLRDTLKEDAKEVIQRLRSKNIEINLLSGDKLVNNQPIAAILGIEPEAIIAEVSPSGKAEHLRAYQKKHPKQVVGMVGDGINDSEALALAQVSVAIGKGADLAKESADIVINGNQLRLLDIAIDHASAVMSRIKQNLGWAFGYNVLAIPLAAGVLVPWGLSFNPMWAGAAMAMSSLSVVLNALRPYRTSNGLSK